MKESQFNMHRFLLVAKRDIMEDWKGNLTKGIGYYALYTIIMISLFINSHGMKFYDFIANMAEWILLFTSIVFIFVSSDVLSPLSSKAKRISFLNLPATNLEKFVWRFLYVSALLTLSDNRKSHAGCPAHWVSLLQAKWRNHNTEIWTPVPFTP